jgi:hypothetical protein
MSLLRDPFRSFRISGSESFDLDDKIAQEHIDPTVAACDNILATVRQEDWHKVSGINHGVLL